MRGGRALEARPAGFDSGRHVSLTWVQRLRIAHSGGRTTQDGISKLSGPWFRSKLTAAGRRCFRSRLKFSMKGASDVDSLKLLIGKALASGPLAGKAPDRIDSCERGSELGNASNRTIHVADRDGR